MKENLKKFLSVILSVMMLTAITSCGKDKRKSQLEDATGSTKQAEALEKAKEESLAESKSDESVNQDKKQSDSYKQEKSDTVSSGSAQEENIEYAPGTLTDNSFESKFIGVKFSLPSDCRIMSKTDLDNQNDQVKKSDDEAQKYMNYEAVITNPDDKMQIIVCVDGNKGSYSELDYLAVVAENYRKAGADVEDNAYPKEIAGKEYLSISTSSNGGKVSYCVRKSGDYMITFITVCADGSEDKMDKLLGEFKKY